MENGAFGMLFRKGVKALLLAAAAVCVSGCSMTISEKNGGGAGNPPENPPAGQVAAKINYKEVSGKLIRQRTEDIFVGSRFSYDDSWMPDLKEGFLFGGWYLDNKLEEPVEYPFTLQEVNTFYAAWEEIVPGKKYTITFNSQGGSSVPSISKEANDEAELPVPTKDGYVFGGWYVDAACSDGNRISSPYTVKRDLTLYAKWTAASSVVSVASVSFVKKSISMNMNERILPDYSVLPADATNKNVSFSSSNPAVVYIENGRLVAKGAGSAVVTVRTEEGGFTDTCTVSVISDADIVHVTGISISETSLSMKQNQTRSLFAEISPANATNQTVMWESSNPAVASVADGVVTGRSAGTATITAVSEDQGFEAGCTVTVEAMTSIILHAKAPYVYVWESGTAMDKIEFTKMTAESGGWYVVTIDATSAKLIFLRSASWDKLSGDLDRTAGEWWWDGEWYDYNPDRPGTPVVKASPAGGTYLSAQMVTLTSSNASDTIYYTLDGSTPSAASSEYGSPISVSGTVTLKARGFNADAVTQWGAVLSETYVVNPNADLEAPEILADREPGRYDSAFNVSFTITDNKTDGFTVYYTTDGTAATTASAVYAVCAAGSRSVTGMALSVAMDERLSVSMLAVDAAGNESSKSFYYSAGETPAATRFDPRQETIYFLLTARWFDGDPNNTVGDQWCSSDDDPAWRGDFKGLVEKLDYIKALGFTCIWITPVVQNRSPLCYHGYHAWDMYKEDARLVSPGYDFQRVVDEVHARGMKICLDVVLQHSGRFGLKDFAEIKYARDPLGCPTPVEWGSGYTYDEAGYEAAYHVSDKTGSSSVQKFPNNWEYDGLKSPGTYPSGWKVDGVDVGGKPIPPSADIMYDVRPFTAADLKVYPYLITARQAGTNLLSHQWPTTESYQLTLDTGDFSAVNGSATASWTYEQYAAAPGLHFHGWANGFNDSGMFDKYPDANLRSIHEDCPDLNTESKEVQEYVIGAYKRYINMGVDMFRVDTLMHIDKKTVNDVFWPEFLKTAASPAAKAARGGGDFFVFGEVANFINNLFNDKPAPIRQSNYTWDDTVTGPDSCISKNAILDGNNYRTPDYSHKAVPESEYHISTIDIVSHNGFCDGYSGAYGRALGTDGAYNDATYLTWYTDSHDYGPNKGETRWNVSEAEFAAAWSMLFTFRGIPIVYYGSEIKFAAGLPNDWPGSTKNTLNLTGRAYYGDNLSGTVSASDFGTYTASGAVATTLSSGLSKHLRDLNRIRLAVPALQMGQYSTDGHSGGWAGYKRRYTGTNKLTGEPIDSYVLVGVGAGQHSWTGALDGTYIDAVTGKQITVSGGNASFTVGGDGGAGLGVYVHTGLKTPAPGKVASESPYF
ncbi:MAG: chitobiase/beta-hexosaminidase C-terminal domain-containing protein [Treponemataceae bacterium]|nr:chitobiase/beta-hexosaminidase C-terminal domain-containing protein [Treponemataceae bacterium]